MASLNDVSRSDLGETIQFVSQSVKNKVGEIANADGIEGISSEQEYNLLSKMLASGELTNQNDIDYVKSTMETYKQQHIYGLQEEDSNQKALVKESLVKYNDVIIDKLEKLEKVKTSITEKLMQTTPAQESSQVKSPKYSAEDIKSLSQTISDGVSLSLLLDSATKKSKLAENAVNVLREKSDEWLNKVDNLIDSFDADSAAVSD